MLRADPTLNSIVLAAVLLCLGCAGSGDAPLLRAGVLDLSALDFDQVGTVPVAGEWRICWGELLDAGSRECPRGWQTFPSPRLWSDSSVSSPIGARGVATYRAELLLPEDAGPLSLRVGSPLTAYRLWIDGEDRGGVGRVGRSPSTTVAKLENRLYPLPRGAHRVELQVHVANFAFRGGGLRREWYLGRDEHVQARVSYELSLYAAFATACVVLGLVFLVLFAFRTQDPARGWFGLFSILVGARIVPGSTGDLYHLLMGWASFDLLIRLEYANTSLLIVTGLLYLRDKIPGVMPTRLTRLLTGIALALVPIQLLAPLPTVLATIAAILALPPLVIALTIVSYGRAARRGLPDARPTLAIAIAFGVGVVHDVVRTQTGWGAPIELFPYFVVVFVAGEAQGLLRSFARSFARAERMSEELQDSNFELQETEEAVVRFVPFDFLRALGKSSIRDVAAGDQLEAEMTVLRCDLPTADSSGSSFAALNDLLGRIEPVIRQHHGFIVQQLGDRFVALFPRSPDDAVEAARELQRTIRADRPVAMAVASGSLVLGTVGDGDSLTSVVMGPPVEAARELHEHSRAKRGGILVSESTRRGLGDASRHGLREIGSLATPRAGRSESDPVYELIDEPA